MRHFENIWVEAEKISSDTDPASILEVLKEEILNLGKANPVDERAVESMGLVLFYLANLSKLYDINVATALQEAIDNKKIEKYE